MANSGVIADGKTQKHILIFKPSHYRQVLYRKLVTPLDSFFLHR
jgi:hypothetical protein